MNPGTIHIVPEAIADILARFVCGISYDDIPETARNAAKRSLLDTMSVAIGAGNAAGAREVIDLARQDGGKTASSILLSGEKVPARSATFVNSMLASALDFDSLHPEAVVHADIVTVPAALAVAEDQRASGRDLLTAIVVGNEILCRLGGSTRLNSGWFYTSVYGSIASAAITAKLLGADVARVSGAMGLGYLSSSGTQQPAVERSISKRMQGALAASAGVAAGYLGARGLSGPREFVEGRFGLFRMYENGDQNVITRELGTRFESEKITYKLYPSCQCNHAAIEGMLQLRREFSLTPDVVRSIEVYVSEYMHRLVGAQFLPGANPQVDAQFSIQYSIAAALLYEGLGVKEIQEASILDTRVLDLTERIVVTVDPENGNTYAPVRLKVVKRDGAVIDHIVTSYRGSPERPLTDADIKEKFAMCLAEGGRTVGTSAVDTLFDATMNIEQFLDMSSAVPKILASVLN
jgi:2-methylcitrate dehydratase PrpD